MIKSNAELANEVNRIIRDNGIKKIWLADKLGMSRQGLDNLLKKQSFSIDDANKILNILNMQVICEINKFTKMQ